MAQKLPIFVDILTSNMALTRHWGKFELGSNINIIFFKSFWDILGLFGVFEIFEFLGSKIFFSKCGLICKDLDQDCILNTEVIK